jgi:hypothetical protein
MSQTREQIMEKAKVMVVVNWMAGTRDPIATMVLKNGPVTGVILAPDGVLGPATEETIKEFLG